MKTVPADEHIRRVRLAKARQFKAVADDALELAPDGSDVADAVVTLLIHAGIAAADALCAKELQVHAKGDSHKDSTRLVSSINPAAGQHLKRLLDMKTRAGYGHDPVSATQLQQAERSASFLLSLANTT